MSPRARAKSLFRKVSFSLIIAPELKLLAISTFMSSDFDISCSQKPYFGAQELFLILYSFTWSFHASSYSHYQILRLFHSPCKAYWKRFLGRFAVGFLIMNVFPFVFLVVFGIIYGCLNSSEWWNFISVFFAYLSNFALPRLLRLCVGSCFLKLYPHEEKWREDREKLIKDLREHSPSHDLLVFAVYGILFTLFALGLLFVSQCNGCYTVTRWVLLAVFSVAAICIFVAWRLFPKSYKCGYLFDEVPESGMIIFCVEKVIYCNPTTAEFFILRSGLWNEVAGTDSVRRCQFACNNSIILTRKSVILANIGEGWTYNTLLEFWQLNDFDEEVLDLKIDHTGQIYFVKEGSNAIHVISVQNEVTVLDLQNDADSINNQSFHGPSGIALDPTGSLMYVADSGNNRIRRINLKTRTPETISFNIDLSSPKSVAICHEAGILFIADTGNHRICVIDLNTRQMRELNTYHYQATGITLNGFYGPQYRAEFQSPKQVVVGPDGDLLVIDVQVMTDTQSIHLIKFPKNELLTVCIH